MKTFDSPEPTRFDLMVRPVANYDAVANGSLPVWDRKDAVHDLVNSDWRLTDVQPRAEEKADRYFANFAIAAKDGHLAIWDCHAQPVALPTHITHIHLIRIERPHSSTGRRTVRPESAWLGLADASQKIVVLAPGYGWDPVEHLVPLAEMCKLELNRKVADLSTRWSKADKYFPGFSSAVFIPVGGRPKTTTNWSRRFDDDLRYA